MDKTVGTTDIKEAIEALRNECKKYKSCILHCPHYIDGFCALNDPLSMSDKVREDFKVDD